MTLAVGMLMKQTTKPYDFTGKTMPAQDVTVYAKWNKPVYNGTIYLTIEGTGSSITLNVPKGDTIETALNEKQAEIMAQVAEGYTWRGWRTGKDGTGEPFNPQTQITTDVTLYPYYTKDGTFKVEYNAVKDGVTAPVDGKSYAEGSFADLKSTGKLVADDGEYFLGWSDGAATYQPRDKYQIKSNHANDQNVIILTAQWGARPAGTTLTYKANGGTGEDMVENLANNATVTTIANPFSRVGYTFKGWDTDPEGEGSIAPNTQVQVDNKDGENVLYAIWTANTDTKYTVEFYYQNTDGTYPQDANKSVVRNDGTTDTTVSVKDSDKLPQDGGKYVFDESNANNVLSGVVAGNGSLVLKLYFKLNTASYTIHHYLNGTTVKVADDQTGAMTIGEELTANKSNALYLAYAAADVASYAPSQTITIAADESENVITVYYTMPLTITAENAEKTYDGQPLTQPDFKMAGLVNGDTKENFSLSMTAASTITNAGSTPNVIDESTVKYKNGDIPSIPTYYNVSYKPGTLTVTPVTDKVTVTVTENSAEHTYDGNEHSVKGYASMTADNTLYDVTKSVKATETAAWTAKGTDAGEYPVGVAAGDFENTNKNFTNVTFNIVDGVLKINPITAEVVVTVTENGAIVTYDGTEHSVKGYKSMTADNKLYDVTKSVKATETAAWTAKGKDAGDYPVGIVAGDFENTNKNFTNVEFVIVDGVLKINPITENTITITANSASKIYDGTPLTNNGFTFTKDVLVEGDVLTAVVEGSATNVGDEGKNVVKSYAVKRGETDVTKNYTFGNSIDGKLTINKRKVTLKSADLSKTYDGTPLVNGKTALATEDGFVSGEGATYTFTGSQTVVGSSANAFTYTLNEGTNAGNYEVAKTEGTLTVTQNEKAITITANSHTWEYDGQAHSDGGYTVEYDGKTYKVEAGETATLPTGDVVKAKITKTVTNVSDSAAGNNTIDELTIVNAAGEDTKGQYKTVTLIPGTLTITKRGAGEEKVKITAADNTVEYDGQPHGAKLNAANQIEVGTSFTVTNLAEGHSVKTLAIEGSETDAGVYADKLVPGKAVIVDGNGVEVTANYDITYVPGTLTITKRGAGDMKVVLTAADNTVVYDGQSHGAKLNAAGEIEAGVSYTITNLANGHKVQSVVISGRETAVGEYENRLVPSGAKIVDAAGNDVTRNYVVGYKNGKLTITSPDTVIVTIRGNKDTVEYDGQKHEVNGYEVVSISNTLYTEADFGFADGATAHAEGTDAGEYSHEPHEGQLREQERELLGGNLRRGRMAG